MSVKTALVGTTRVPAISLGTWSWGDKTWGYKPEDFPQIKEAWFACLESGYPFFDTAEVYGGWSTCESSCSKESELMDML
jgi:aryl-alcohol dehydrogenase-like predicted oxidoreductase